MKGKKIISIFLAITAIIFILPVSTYARTVPEADAYVLNESAVCLNRLGLFKGVSDTDFDLYRPATRVEAVVMIIRLLGEETNALADHYSHPFTDVPEWANDYIGYAYANGITNGITKDQFGTDNVTASMYITYLLRILGYSEADGDFTWDNPFPLAYEVGILDDDSDCFCDLNEFWRADMSFISESALMATPKNGNTIAGQLSSKGLFSAIEYIIISGAYAASAFGYFGSETLYYDYIHSQNTSKETLVVPSKNPINTDTEEPITVYQTEPVEQDTYNTRQEDTLVAEEEPITIYQTDQDQESSVIVYITPTGKRWHADPDCGGVNSFPVTLSEAEHRGFTPCQKCVH